MVFPTECLLDPRLFAPRFRQHVGTLVTHGKTGVCARISITIREDGKLAPNSTVVEQYLEGTEAVTLAYNDSANEIAIIPLEQNYDRGDVYAYRAGNTQTISARGFLKNNDIIPDKTIRYTQEWDDNIGGDHVDGGFRLDLDQDGEVVTIDSSNEEPDDDTDNDTATPDR
ncbi:hypothetical protein [Halobellus sp. Atlit-38R]|uniref:hypothetical protein n=1 Tax=Halobellus sp. Atlit-38R TaxID=2282131 RepID=UPI0011C472C9|nr:hypothetical protein [Halobellus sp. Atlit-38R]